MQVEKTENNTENGKVSVVVATRVVATKSKGSARGELVEANQDEPEWSSEDEDESLGDTLQTWTQKQRKLLGNSYSIKSNIRNRTGNRFRDRLSHIAYFDWRFSTIFSQISLHVVEK